MKSEPSNFQASARNYLSQVQESFTPEILEKIENLTTDLLDAWIKHQKVFICGNGGSAANALHMANDFHYGIGACGEGKKIPGLHVDALPANTGVITCLANDTGYENIYTIGMYYGLTKKEIDARRDDIITFSEIKSFYKSAKCENV